MTQAPPDNPRLGIAWMLVTMFMFVSMDACAKYLVSEHHVVQVVWGRYFFHAALLTVILAPRLRTVIVTGNLKLQLARSLLLMVTTGLFFSGLRYIPMADASAIMLISPIVVTALSMPLLKERVGPRRWVSVAIGCIGALVIIRPGAGVFHLAALLPLTAAVFYGVYQISTRFLSHSDPILTTLFYSASIGALLASVAAPFFWQPLSALDWALMVLAGLFGALGHFALIKALSIAPPATVAPFTYSNLIWATLYGFVVFSDIPDLWTIVGAVIIVASGLYIYHRESVVKKRNADSSQETNA